MHQIVEGIWIDVRYLLELTARGMNWLLLKAGTGIEGAYEKKIDDLVFHLIV
jgi:hypothetical protein